MSVQDNYNFLYLIFYFKSLIEEEEEEMGEICAIIRLSNSSPLHQGGWIFSMTFMNAMNSQL